jgi:chitin synthase
LLLWLQVGRNIKYMMSHKIDSPDFRALGGGIWRKIVTTIVADGRQQMDPSSMRWLDDMGLVDEKLMMVSLMGDSRPELHLFEGSVQVSRPQKQEQKQKQKQPVQPPISQPPQSQSPQQRGAKRQSTFGRGRASIVKAMDTMRGTASRQRAIFMPMQLQIAIKEHNAGKLDSHNWAMRGFAGQMQPKYMILLDAGTNPSPSAIHKLLKVMEMRPHLGGCCGEIAVDHPFEHLTNPTVAAQNFEYKVSFA